MPGRAIGELEVLDRSAGFREPARQLESGRATVHLQDELVEVARRRQIGGGDISLEPDRVGALRAPVEEEFVDDVDIASGAKHVDIVAVAAPREVLARAAVEEIVPGSPEQAVVAASP